MKITEINKKILIAVPVVLIAAGGVGFYLIKNHTTQASNQSSQTNDTTNNSQNSFGGRGSMRNFATVRGEVSSIDGKNAVVEAQNNQGQRIVTLSDTTTVTKSVDATKDEVLTVDNQITINGKKGDDGSVSADIIQLMMPRNNQRMQDQNGDTPQVTRQRPSGTPQMRFGGQGQNSFLDPNTFIGKIKSVDGSKVTITSLNNSDLVINISDDTKFKKQVVGTIADIVTGSKVTVIGNSNTSCSINARNVVISN